MYRFDPAARRIADPHNATDDETRLRESLVRLASAGERAAAQLGRFDPITGLPTRAQFMDDFAGAVDDGHRSLVLVTLADGRHFNELQRALGHAYSENFIRAGAERLQSLLPPDTVLYHVSLLTFVLFGRETAKPSAPTALVEDIVRAFRPSIVCNNIPIDTRAGVGLAAMTPGAAPGEVLRAALAAAQESRKGFDGWAVYDRGSDAAQMRAFRLLSDLPGALRGEGQFALHFQPRIAMQEGVCTGAEALVRWMHPEFGPVPPGEFVPLAEPTALIGSLTRWVVTHGLRAAAHWQANGHDLRLSINVSPRNLEEPHFVDFLHAELNRFDVDPALLELEFTEGALASNAGLMLEQMARLRRLGFQIAIDDFGSGYSNMGTLGALPAQVLKIDRSLLRSLETDRRKQVLVRSIIQLAHALDFEVVAEGIETREAFRLLCGWDCDAGQGYFMSKALALADFDRWYELRGSKQVFYD
ncbi:putative bifunctional diguanylate cyclase/phosphodiesterase [Aquibium microcysteis]|uniref:putative bifunctional diguanylate cyclase/phosphodiesterase n=1 Tax=Aquibium microcysteis TaxID=675281 RepID=UPI00165D27CB|nr:bifunctional diguanylate cyclase/phosphodiesterase [Aquibium microcysteis]